jgi:hypothetical protein
MARPSDSSRGGEDVGQQRAALAPHLQALGEVNLDKAAMAAVEFAEGINCFDHARTLRPAAADTRGHGHHRHHTLAQRLHSGLSIARVQARAGIEEIAFAHIVDAGFAGQAVLPQPNPSGAQAALDLLVLHRIETQGI